LAHRAKRVVDEWIELLGQPTDLKSLRFTSRTPKRLFAALGGQPQLTSLASKWGDYADRVHPFPEGLGSGTSGAWAKDATRIEPRR
jgi:hypothetical protein